MANGLQADFGQGSFTADITRPLTGIEVAAAGGLLSISQAVTGIEIGTAVGSSAATTVVVRLISRRVGSGTASNQLTGIPFGAQGGLVVPAALRPLEGIQANLTGGSFGKTQTKALQGIPCAVLGGILTPSGSGQVLPIGNLVHDGPAIPEGINLWLSAQPSLPQTATATCRYRVLGSPTWITGHPLYRVQPARNYPPQNTGGVIEDGFGWPIIGLTPNTAYEVEVSVTSGAVTNIRSLNHTTRALPGAAGAVTKTANSVTQVNNQIGGLVPGDVLQLTAVDFNISTPFTISASGNPGSPIVIRGISRSGTRIIRSANDHFFRLANGVHDVIIENMTFVGSGNDGNGSIGMTTVVDAYTNAATYDRITIRQTTATGVDRGFYGWVGNQVLIYNNTWTGNDLWQVSPINFLTSSPGIAWDDDGINCPGRGNAVFNNTLKGFGDTMAYATHSGSEVVNDNIGTHFYRNDIRNSCDDNVEIDHARRNCAFYDNRSHNACNFSSIDPLYGGPFLFARNTLINPFRIRLHKWNDLNSGMFFYNNTSVATVSAEPAGDTAAWWQPQSDPQESYGYRNNLVVYRGGGSSVIYFSNPQPTIVDWTHNSWFPDRVFHWDETGSANFANLAAAQAGVPNTTPIFSGTNRRHLQDTISSSNPWTTTVTFGVNSLTEVTATYTLPLAAGTAKNSGVVIPNITDGFTGALPDRGSVIAGRAAVTYGDLTSLTLPYNPPTTVNFSVAINANTVNDIEPPPWSGAVPWWELCLFNTFGFGTFVPKWGTHGGYVVSANGGHGDGSNVDLVIFDMADAQWKFFNNANGVPSRSGNFALNETNGSPFYEVTAATSGQFPVVPHPYNNLVATDDGVNGSVMYVGRGAITNGATTGNTLWSFTAHYQDLTNRQWLRRSSGTAAYTFTSNMYEGSSCADPTAGRYYYASNGEPNQHTFLAYLQREVGSNWTWQQTPNFASLPPSHGAAVLFCCDQHRMLIWHVGNAFWGLNLTNNTTIAAGWQAIGTTGTAVPTCNHAQWAWHPRKQAFYWKAARNSGNTLHVLTPPAGTTPVFSGWTMSQVSIGGAGLPGVPANWSGEPLNNHYSGLQYVPSIDRLLWMGNGQAGGVVIIEV